MFDVMYFYADLSKTSLLKSIELFRSQFLHPLLKSCKVRFLLKYAFKICHEVNHSHDQIFVQQVELESAYNEKIQKSQATLDW